MKNKNLLSMLNKYFLKILCILALLSSFSLFSLNSFFNSESENSNSYVNSSQENKFNYGESAELNSQGDQSSSFQIKNNSDLIKIYKQDNPLITSKNNFSFKNIVAAKISGLPKNSNNDIVINEINFLDSNNQLIDYRVTYIRQDIEQKDNESKIPKTNNADKSNNYNLNDGDIETELVLSNIVSPMAVEINFSFDGTVNISDIKMLMDLKSSNSSWDKIGSIELMDVYGNVYRKDGLAIDSIINRKDPNGSTDFNFKRKIIIFSDDRKYRVTTEKKPGTLISYTNIWDKPYEVAILKDIDMAIDDNPKKFVINIDTSSIKHAIGPNIIKEPWENYSSNDNYKKYFDKSFGKVTIELNNNKVVDNEVFLKLSPIKTRVQYEFSISLKWKKNSLDKWDLIASKTSSHHNNTGEDDAVVRFNIFQELNSDLWNKNNSQDHFISFKTNDIKWSVYKENTPSNTNNRLFMYSYNSSINSPNSDQDIYFYSNSITSRSIVPIFNPLGTSISVWDNKLEKNLGLVELIHNPSEAEMISLLSIFSDTGLYDSLKNLFNIVDDKSISLSDLISLLKTYDFKNKNNHVSQNNPKSFNIDIYFNDDGNTVDTFNLDIFQYFSILQNPYNIEFHTNRKFKNILYFNLENLSWASSIQNLNSIKLSYGGEIDYNNLSQTDLRVFGRFEYMKWIKDSNVKWLDLRSFDNFYNDKNVIQYFNKQRYVPELPIDFKVLISKNEYDKLSQDDIINLEKKWKINLVIKSTDNLEKNYVVFTKKSIPTLPDPKIVLNNKTNEYELNSLIVNKKTVKPFLSNGKMYWNFSAIGIKASEIIYSNANFTNFFTEEYVKDTGIINNLVSVQGIDYDDLETVNVEINEPSTDEIEYNKFIKVDGNRYYYKIINGSPFINFSLGKIKYLVLDLLDSNNPLFFTSIDEVVKYNKNNLDISVLQAYNYKYVNHIANDDIKREYDNQIESLLFKYPERGIENVIYIDDKKINDVIIIKGEMYWNLNNNFKLSSIKYRSSDNHFYTKLFNDDSQLVQNLSSIKSVPDYADDISHLSPLRDPGKLKNTEDLKKTIDVDGKIYGVVVKDDFVYYNFAIDKIKYAYIDKELDIIKYFTDINKIDINLDFSKIYSLEEAITRDVPIPNDIYNISFKQEEVIAILIDGEEYYSYLKFGKWSWDIPKDIAIKIKFIDENGNYYTNITQEIINQKVLTSINVQSDIDSYTPNNYHFPINLHTDIDLLNNNFMYDGKKYVYIVKDSKIYIPDQIYKNIQFYVLDQKGMYHFYSGMKYIKDEERDKAWTFDKANKNEVIGNYNGEQFLDPNKNDLLNIKILHNGTIYVISIINKDNRKYYANIDNLIQKIKWIDLETNIYYTNANDLPKSSSIQSVNMNDISIESFVKESDVVFKDIVMNSKKITLTIAIGISSSVVLLSIIAAAIGFAYSRKVKLWK